MSNKQVIKVIPLILVVLIALSYAVYASASNTPAVSDVERLSAEPGMKRMNFELKEASHAPKLNKQDAIKRAKDIIGDAFDNDNATSVNAVYTLFTDKVAPDLLQPEKNILIKDLPVWIVTFDGIKIPGHGVPVMPSEKPEQNHINTQLNVVVDANTGEEIMMFSYK